MAGILTKGITLSYKKELNSYETIANLMECPQLGGAAERVDVTTLDDAVRKYINGVKEYGELAFKFLYDNSAETSNYRIVRGLEEAGKMVEWKVTFPDTTEFTFSGQVSTQIDSSAVNAAVTFTANIALNSDIAVKNPGVGG